MGRRGSDVKGKGRREHPGRENWKTWGVGRREQNEWGGKVRYMGRKTDRKIHRKIHRTIHR